MSNIRYASIRELDISNGEGIGVSLFVQGCDIHCPDCFNLETWDFNGGKEWTKECLNNLLKLIDRPYIKRVSILGGEPLAYQNLFDVYNIVSTIKEKFPNKKIWLYTGKKLKFSDFDDNVDPAKDNRLLKNYILSKCDIVVDGPYIKELKDSSLKFRGSSNQTIIDVPMTIANGRINSIIYKK